MNKLYEVALERISLEHELRGGIPIKVRSKADWYVLNEVFIEGDYDVALNAALIQHENSSGITVMDLGANVGFFSLRALHLGHRLCPGMPIRLLCVEGSAGTFLELERRLGGLTGVHLIHGLVGDKNGKARLLDDPYHAMTALDPSASKRGKLVSYVDLDSLSTHWPNIDLLKCDIEGAEERFLEEYSDLLRRTRRVIIEFHSSRVNENHCLGLLASYGFKLQAVIMRNEWISLQYFTRVDGELAGS